MISLSIGGKPISKDLRNRVVDIHDAGDGYKDNSKALLIPRSMVKSVIKSWQVFGTIGPSLDPAIPPNWMQEQKVNC